MALLQHCIMLLGDTAFGNRNLRTMFAGIALACTAVSVAQAADPLQLACTGDMIEPGELPRL